MRLKLYVSRRAGEQKNRAKQYKTIGKSFHLECEFSSECCSCFTVILHTGSMLCLLSCLLDVLLVFTPCAADFSSEKSLSSLYLQVCSMRMCAFLCVCDCVRESGPVMPYPGECIVQRNRGAEGRKRERKEMEESTVRPV